MDESDVADVVTAVEKVVAVMVQPRAAS
jgi:hypothetical protein